MLVWLSVFGVPLRAQSPPNQPAIPQIKVELPEIVAGGDRTISQPVDKDLFLAGGQVAITTEIEGDAFVAGGQINIGGTIGGNLIAAGGNITVTGQVTGNIIVAGGQVMIDQNARVGGYVLAGAGQVTINGQIAGPVKMGAGKLTVGNEASIGGNLEADVAEAEISETATITGEKKIVIREIKTPKVPMQTVEGWALGSALISFLGKLLVLVILVKLFGHMLKPAKDWLKLLWPTMGWGLIVLVITPVLTVILLLTIVGIPLAFILMMLYLITMYLSSLVTAGAVGNWMVEKNWLRTENKYLEAIAGLVVITILGKIPLIGGMISFVVLLLGLGIIFKLATETKRKPGGKD